jgi:hypothetical protein
VLFRSELQQLRGNIHINEADKNNNDNNATPIFMGLNKTTEKTWTPQERAQEEIKSDIL